MCPGVAVNIRGNMFVYTCPCIWGGACPCVFMFVRSLTPGWPPLLGLHGQRTHHSAHLRSRRGGGTSVHWSLCQFGTCLRLGGTHTVSRLLPLLILLHPLSAEPLFLSFALSCFFTPPHTALPSPSLALHSPSPSLPLSLLSRRCSLPPIFTHKPRGWVKEYVIHFENVDSVNY